MAVVQVQNVCDPTNTANVWIANFTGVPIDAITRRTLAYQTGVAIAATLAVVVRGAGALWAEPVSRACRLARADETLPGFYAPPSARNRIAVDDDGTALGRAAADAVARSARRAARGNRLAFTIIRTRADCARKSLCGVRGRYSFDLRAESKATISTSVCDCKIAAAGSSTMARPRDGSASTNGARSARPRACKASRGCEPGRRPIRFAAQIFSNAASPRGQATNQRISTRSSRRTTAICEPTFEPAARPTLPDCARATSSRRSTG